MLSWRLLLWTLQRDKRFNYLFDRFDSFRLFVPISLEVRYASSIQKVFCFLIPKNNFWEPKHGSVAWWTNVTAH